MAGNVRIVVPPEIAQWAAGFRDLPDNAVRAGERHWKVATEVFFDRTQQYVHVLTGNLKSSGTSRVTVAGKTIVGEVAYGGADVDYAIYEEARGGEHAFLTRGWEATNRTFAAAVPLIMADAMRDFGR